MVLPPFGRNPGKKRLLRSGFPFVGTLSSGHHRWNFLSRLECLIPGSKPSKGFDQTIKFELGKENQRFEVLGFSNWVFLFLLRLTCLGLKLIFVLVEKVVWFVERNIVLNFGSDRRWSEFGGGRPPLQRRRRQRCHFWVGFNVI